MTTKITLASKADGFSIGALRADPEGEPLGGVVVVQEIFGLSDHVGEICDRFAVAGYTAIAPGVFDRIERDFQAGHDPEGVQKGVRAVMASPWPQVMGDVAAAIEALPKPVYVTGFCYGGAVAYMAAAHCAGLAAAASFYGRLIAERLEDKPRIPIMLHYGANDPGIPPANYEKVRLALPDSPLYLYDAGHGFCRSGSADFNEAARDLALTRTLDWFARWR